MPNPNTCKSAYCIICKNCMGRDESGKLLCTITDVAPCENFIYNGAPCAEITEFQSEITNEYLLGLGKQCHNRDD